MGMESQNNSMKKLPIGFRFHPTDEELIVHYLRRKALSVPLPASVIPEFNVFETYPWNLPGGSGSGSGSGSSEELREKKYFFSKSNHQSGNNRCIRVQSGYWKPIGKRKQVVGSGSKQPVGFKRILMFYLGKSRTDWIIYEFRLLGLLQKVLLKDWVVYKLFQKKRKPSNHKKINCIAEDNSHMGAASQTTSSCSSDITELSSTTDEEEEEEEETTSSVFLP